MRLLALLAVAALASGCASSYKSVDYDAPAFTTAPPDDGLAFAYQYDAQPGYYGEKARKRGYSVVAVRVTNTTDAPVVVDRNSLRVLYGANPILPVRAQVVADNVNQPVWTHLLWSFLNVTIFDGNGDVQAFIPSGFALAGGHIYVASSANSKADRAFVEQDLFGQRVNPGETAVGLIYLSETGSAPLTFDYVPPAAPVETASPPTETGE